MGNKSLSRPSRSGTSAQIESLEPRQFFSAPHYDTLIVSDYFGHKLASSLTVVGVSDDGSVVVNSGKLGQAYVFSSRRKRLYRPMDRASGITLSTSGQLLAESIGGTSTPSYFDISIATGANKSVTFNLPSNDPEVLGTAPTALNAAGFIVGSQETFHDHQQTLGNFTSFEPVAFDPGTNQTTLLAGTDPNGYVSGYPSPLLLNENGVIAFQTSIYATPAAQPTSLPSGDGSVFALSDNFAVGQTGRGIYLYNLNTQTQSTFALPSGIESFTATGVNDSGIVVGTMSVYQRVHGHPRFVNVAGAFERGKFFNLNTLTQLPAGRSLAGAFAVNASGQIVASTNSDNHAGGRVVLLSPTLV